MIQHHNIHLFKENNDGIPNMVKILTVNTFIGITKFSEVANKL